MVKTIKLEQSSLVRTILLFLVLILQIRVRVGAACDAGYAPDGDSCLPCPAGYYSSIDSETCTPCVPGTFTAKEGSPSCTNCPEGTYQSEDGQTSCTNCVAVYRIGSRWIERSSLNLLNEIPY